MIRDLQVKATLKLVRESFLEGVVSRVHRGHRRLEGAFFTNGLHEPIVVGIACGENMTNEYGKTGPRVVYTRSQSAYRPSTVK